MSEQPKPEQRREGHSQLYWDKDSQTMKTRDPHPVSAEQGLTAEQFWSEWRATQDYPEWPAELLPKDACAFAEAFATRKVAEQAAEIERLGRDLEFQRKLDGKLLHRAEQAERERDEVLELIRKVYSAEVNSVKAQVSFANIRGGWYDWWQRAEALLAKRGK